MDPRIERHAEIVVDHSTSVEAGDEVVVSAPPNAEDLVVALFEALGDRGANVSWSASSSRARRAYLLASDAETFDVTEHELAAAKAADVMISVRADRNTNETGDVPPETNTAYGTANKPVQEARMNTRWCVTQHPAPGNAQAAELSSPAYADFVYGAVDKDWDAQRTHQERMVEILDPASEVRIVSRDGTDVTMSVDDMKTINDFAEHNLPGGEVFTAPVVDSVEGTVHFDMPLIAQGREVRDVRLTFEEGVVVDHAAGKNEEVLTAVLDTDEGARRLGELGIGMNRDIDRFTYNMLFDEKMGDTVHMALGRAYGETVGPDREVNDSAVHVDMIIDMAKESFVEVDGEVVQRNGTFRFEEGFEG